MDLYRCFHVLFVCFCFNPCELNTDLFTVVVFYTPCKRLSVCGYVKQKRNEAIRVATCHVLGGCYGAHQQLFTGIKAYRSHLSHPLKLVKVSQKYVPVHINAELNESGGLDSSLVVCSAGCPALCNIMGQSSSWENFFSRGDFSLGVTMGSDSISPKLLWVRV